MLTRNLMLFLLTIYALIVVAALWERRWTMVAYWTGAILILGSVLWMES